MHALGDCALKPERWEGHILPSKLVGDVEFQVFDEPKFKGNTERERALEHDIRLHRSLQAMKAKGFVVKDGDHYSGTFVPYCDYPRSILRTNKVRGTLPGHRPSSVSMLVPCRKCPKCLWLRRETWKTRIKAETSAPTIFATLTFSEDLLDQKRRLFDEKYDCAPDEILSHPSMWGQSLAQYERLFYSDVHDWLRRCRRNLDTKFRYFVGFEFGDKSGREHYHVALHFARKSDHFPQLVQDQWPCRAGADWAISTEDVSGYLSKYGSKSLVTRPRASVSYGEAPLLA